MSQDIKPEVKTQDTFKLGKTSKEMNLKKKKKLELWPRAWSSKNQKKSFIKEMTYQYYKK